MCLSEFAHQFCEVLLTGSAKKPELPEVPAYTEPDVTRIFSYEARLSGNVRNQNYPV
jgi:hypothetical protein